MSSEQPLSADVVIVGSGVAGSSIANELARAGISVIVLEAGPRVDRQHFVENFRNLENKPSYQGPFPAVPWARHPPNQMTPNEYLHTTGPDAEAYQQVYLRMMGEPPGTGPGAPGGIYHQILSFGPVMGKGATGP